MSKTVLQAIGLAMLAAPFLAAIGWGIYLIGWLPTMAVVGAWIFLIFWIGVGTYLSTR